MFRRTCKWHHAELSRACEEDALGELDEEEVASATGRAQSLAKEALAFLHREQCQQRALQEAAREEVCQQERLKEEWRRREHWVKSEACEFPDFRQHHESSKSGSARRYFAGGQVSLASLRWALTFS